MNDEIPRWVTEALARAGDDFKHEGNAIYLFEVPPRPRDQAHPTELLCAVESLFAQENVLSKAHVHTTTEQMTIGWLLAIAGAGPPPWCEELEAAKVKVTKVRNGKVSDVVIDDDYETDHEAGAQAAAGTGTAFSMH
ncbi:hypothetical protein Slin15195_G082640 [Septoria linicola]|uniref:Uncharacterized protein n=1 Tax=Septoria linicola TaxID=215465 RepID=A0A9Q9ELC1_9PEZI|nr:hypothetical protein Slin14017_G130740 [Septoria linicola]USW54945.1 hypothetical protein Slin15195_G082640 [Septoria linicola]